MDDYFFLNQMVHIFTGVFVGHVSVLNIVFTWLQDFLFYYSMNASIFHGIQLNFIGKIGAIFYFSFDTPSAPPRHTMSHNVVIVMKIMDSVKIPFIFNWRIILNLQCRCGIDLLIKVSFVSHLIKQDEECMLTE